MGEGPPPQNLLAPRRNLSESGKREVFSKGRRMQTPQAKEDSGGRRLREPPHAPSVPQQADRWCDSTVLGLLSLPRAGFHEEHHPAPSPPGSLQANASFTTCTACSPGSQVSPLQPTPPHEHPWLPPTGRLHPKRVRIHQPRPATIQLSEIPLSPPPLLVYQPPSPSCGLCILHLQALLWHGTSFHGTPFRACVFSLPNTHRLATQF